MHGPPSRLARRAVLATSAAAILATRTRGAHADPVAIDGEITAVRLRYGLPGAVAMVLRAGAVAAQGTSGVRSVIDLPQEPRTNGSLRVTGMLLVTERTPDALCAATAPALSTIATAPGRP